MMKKRFISVLLAAVMVFALLPATVWADQPNGMKEMAASAAFVGSGGNGTEDEPYLISNLDDLEAFRDYINSDADGGSGEYFKLTADIDMTDKYGAGGITWTPIGTFSTGFNGEFDGAGHTVKVSLLYTDSTVNYIGLFGTVGSYISEARGAISNLSVSGSISSTADVTAIGGIMGQNGNGMIESCYSSVNINGKGSIGGIAGMNTLGSISNCYNTGDITNSSTDSSDGTGGIAGDNYEWIESCYNTGKITLAEGGAAAVGGIAGTGGLGTVSTCYYLTGTAEKGIGDEYEGTAENVEEKTAEEFKKLASALNNGYGNVWKDSLFLGRPVFTAFPEGGDGKEATPYTIPDLATLEAFRDYINNDTDGGKGESFKLTADINMSDKYSVRKTSWTPIGAGSKSFYGTFDGDGHTISELYINTTDLNQGLFGNVGSSGTIKNLTVSGSVTGSTNTGGIAGKNYGIISDCTNNCNVTGKSDYVGGIAGYNYNSIKNCYNTGEISNSNGTNNYVGGIAGKNSGSVSIENCHNVGIITGKGGYIGGIAGSNESSRIENCYNEGTITGTGDYTGGIAGSNESSGRIGNCYNEGEVSGNNSVGGIAGSNGSNIFENCYNKGKVSGTGESIGGIAGQTSSDIKNCYYLDTSCDKAGGGTSRTTDQFASGEVAWLLQNGQSAQVWGQTLGGTDEYPVLTGEADKKVCKVTFATSSQLEYAAEYVNNNGTVKLPAEPTLDGTVFDHWSTTKSVNGGSTFDHTTKVTGDVTVYAVGRKTFGGESEEIALTTTYGTALTEDLSEHIAYKIGTTTAGEFEYEIKTGNDVLNATIEDDILTIPGTANVGDYSLTIRATETAPQYSLMSVGSYGTTDVTLAVKVSIAKAESSVTVEPAANALTYDGTAQQLVTAGTADGGEMRYSLDNAVYSADIPKGTEAKAYTVWYKVVGDSNHNDSTPQSVEVTIKKANSDVTVADSSATYGDTLTLTAEVKKSNAAGISLMSVEQDKVDFKAGEASLGTATVEYTDSELKSVGTVTLTVTVDKAKYNAIKAANGKITAEYGGSVNLNESTKDNITVTLNKKTLTYTAAATNRAYNGGTTVEVSLTPTNAEGDNVTLTATGTIGDANVGDGKSVTITGVTVGGADAEYYQAADAPTEAVTVNIEKADSTVTAPTAKTDLTYNGTAQELLATAGSATGGELQYKVNGGTYSTAAPTATTAGEHTVYYKVVGNDNYNGIDEQSITVNIAKAKPTFPTVDEVDGGTYEPDKKLSSVTVPEVDGGTLAWSDENTVLTVGENSVQAVFTSSDTTNYEGTATGTVKVNVAKADSTVISPTAKTDLTYDGTAQELVTAGTVDGGEMRYSLEQNGSYSDEIPTGTNAQTYTVWYKVMGDANHNDTVAQSISVTIAKATPTVTVNASDSPTYGSDITLTAAVSSSAIGADKLTGTVQFKIGEENLGTAVDVENGTATLTIGGTSTGLQKKLFGNTGTSTVIAEYSGNANIADGSGTREVTVTPRALSYTVTAAGREYNGEKTVSVTLTPNELIGSDTVTLTATGALSGANAATYDAVDLSGITKSGADARYYSVAASANNQTIQGGVIIAQRVVTLTWKLDDGDTFTVDYTGGAHTVTAQVGNKVNSDDVSVTVEVKPNGGSVASEAIEVGTYTATATGLTGASAGNYTLTGSDATTQTITIQPVAASATTVPEAKSGLTFTGAPLELVTGGTSETGTVAYSLSANADTHPNDETFTATVPQGTNAGTYYVWWKVRGDANHSDTAAQSISVTVSPAPITFQAVEVNTPYTGAVISVTVSQTKGETPVIDPAKIAVSYEQDGAAAEPVLPGTYDVIVTVNDSNFTLAGTAKVGTLTITHVHVYAEEWTHDSSNHWHDCQGVGECGAPRNDIAVHRLTWVDSDPDQHWQACDVCGWTGEKNAHDWDEGVVTLEPTTEAEGSRLYTCSVCGATKSEPISKLDTFRISGVVTDNDDKPLAGATVRLTRGNDVVAETTTDSYGRYSFSSVPAGLYNVAATWETVTKTILVELSDADANEQNIQMPAGNVSSVVEVRGDDTPAVVVGGVDTLADEEATTSPGETVTVTLTVEKKDAPADKEALEAAASTQAAHLTYLDMTLTKTTTGAGSSEEPITEAGVVLEIVIPFDFTYKTNVTAYRSHGNLADALTKADAGAKVDGTFLLDEAGGKIYIYASKFSTYAIGYTPAPPVPLTYTATVTQSEHGNLKVSPTRVTAGNRVTVTVTPDEDYELGTLTITDSNGNTVEYKDNGDGTFTFIMPFGGVEIDATFVLACKRDYTCPIAKFTDATPTEWYHDGVHYCLEHGLMVGTSATTFSPNTPTSRAMVITILWKDAGSPVVNYLMQYDDVETDTWYTEAIRWATSEGIVVGYGNGKFGPDDPITNEQIATVLWRYAKNKGWSVSVGEDTNILSFKDFDQISEWAIPAIQWAAGSGIMQDKDGILDPQGQATRAQTAGMFQQFLTSRKVEENT